MYGMNVWLFGVKKMSVRKPVLFRMECFCCGKSKALAVLEDKNRKLYATCSNGCGTFFAENGIVRFIKRLSKPEEIHPVAWDSKQTAAFLSNHPFF